MSTPLFLIGAGFNADAASEACSSDYCYPLLSDLRSFFPGFNGQHCSIEECFAEAMEKHDRKPLEALSEQLMETDYYLGSRLCSGERRVNTYLTFMNHYSDASFLTFNYDSLLEILLFSLNRWHPQDGYGVPVINSSSAQEVAEPSRNLVLHLHGSLCIYSSNYETTPRLDSSLYMLKQKKQPEFIFAPDEIAGLFPGCCESSSKLNYCYPYERIIAPVPNKARGLTQSFVRSVYDRAREILERTKTVIVIGYSFSPHDRNSYEPLLRAATGVTRIILVSPDSLELQSRLKDEYPKFQWQALPLTFREWTHQGFQEVNI